MFLYIQKLRQVLMEQSLTITEQNVLHVALDHLEEHLEEHLEYLIKYGIDEDEADLYQDRYDALLSLKIKLGIK